MGLLYNRQNDLSPDKQENYCDKLKFASLYCKNAAVVLYCFKSINIGG